MKNIRTFLEHVKYSKDFYHGSLINFEKFKGDVFLSETEDFAYRYALTKSSDLGIDNDVILYTVDVSNCNIFDIKEGNNKYELLENLPNEINFVYNNFGFKTSANKNDLINELSGVTNIKADEQFKNCKIGDIIPYTEYDGTYTYKLYYVINIEDNVAYTRLLVYSTSSNTHFNFKFDKSELYKEDNYKYDIEKVTKDNNINMIYNILTNSEHRLHNDVIVNINNYLEKDYKKTYSRIQKFPLKDVIVEIDDNWRYYENEDVRNTIISMGYDGYVAKEKGVNTICIYEFANNKLRIKNKTL